MSTQEIEEGILSTPTVTWDPFTLFPKEIYLEIFKKLQIPSDKLNFMNAHVKFYDLFKSERVKFLFGKVFGKLIPLALEDEKEGEMPEKYLVRLRLICRDWDKSIQNYYQYHSDHFLFRLFENELENAEHQLNSFTPGFQASSMRLLWGETKEIQPDLKEFMASHPPSKNPFVMRKVNLNVDSWTLGREGNRIVWSKIDTLFEAYGHHIWHFVFRDQSDLTPGIFSKLLQWLRFMPELKVLQMEFSCDYESSAVCPDPANFNSIIQTQPPELRKLQNLHVSNFPPFAFNKLLEGMKFLEKIEVFFPQLLGFQFPTSLREAAFFLKVFEEIEYLNTLEQFPTLRKLILNRDMDSFSPDWKRLWEIIEEKFPSLEDLHLNLPRARCTGANKRTIMEQSLDCRLNLRKLKRLIILLPNLSSLDFLQENKTLQELKIYLQRSCSKDKLKDFDLVRRESIQFNKDLATMWDSNIWQVFPNLRKLYIHDFKSYGDGKASAVYTYEKGPGEEKTYKKKNYSQTPNTLS